MAVVTVKQASLLAAAAAFSVWAVPASANLADLQGTWIHLGDRYGFAIGHIELVEVGAYGEVSVSMFRNRAGDSACAAAPGSDACANPQQTERGRIIVEPAAHTLRVADLEEVNPAFPVDLRQVDWQVVRFANDAHWSYELAGDELRLSRSGEIDGFVLDLTKTYYRVDRDMPADLFGYFSAMSLSVVRAGCALDAIQGDANLRAQFRELIAEVQDYEDALGTPRLSQVARWMSDNPDDKDALFPAAVPLLPAIKACIAEFY